MQFSKFLIYASLVLLTFVFACKQTASVLDINGKTLKEIQSSTIITADGQQFVLQEDSISKIYYLVRHAEKDTSIKDEPPLAPEGVKRATRIADILKGTRVDAIYSTLTLRTMFTVDSLADIKAMTIKPYENKELKTLLDDVKKSTDFNRIFIVGHANTIPSITNSLAGRQIFNRVFEENEYDNFVIVVEKKSGNTDVYTLKF